MTTIMLFWIHSATIFRILHHQAQNRYTNRQSSFWIILSRLQLLSWILHAFHPFPYQHYVAWHHLCIPLPYSLLFIFLTFTILLKVLHQTFLLCFLSLSSSLPPLDLLTSHFLQFLKAFDQFRFKTSEYSFILQSVIPKLHAFIYHWCNYII